MTIYELIAEAKSKHINDPVKVASWIVNTQKDWKQGYKATKLLVEVCQMQTEVFGTEQYN